MCEATFPGHQSMTLWLSDHTNSIRLVLESPKAHTCRFNPQIACTVPTVNALPIGISLALLGF